MAPNLSVQVLTNISYLAKLLKKVILNLFFKDFRDLEELRNDPDSFPFEDHIEATALRKSYNCRF